MLTPKQGAGREFAPTSRELASVMNLTSCDCLTVYSCRKSKSPKLCRLLCVFAIQYYTSFIRLLATFLQDLTDFKRSKQMYWPISRYPKSWYQHKLFHLTTLTLWVIFSRYSLFPDFVIKSLFWPFSLFQGHGYCFL